jgi:hypothetical protein
VTTAVLTNLTRPGAVLQAGDQFGLHITGTPNSEVRVDGTFPSGDAFSTVFGVTDAAGIYDTQGFEGPEHVGPWVMVWSVGGQAAPTMNIEVLPAGEAQDLVTEQDLVVTTPVSAIPTWAWALGGVAVLWFLMKGNR